MHMSLSKYISACNEFVSELKECLTTEDIDALYEDLLPIGETGMRQWICDNTRGIGLFVLCTPSERRSKKQWKDRRLWRRLTIAAIYHVQRAKAVLIAVEENNLTPGSAYRQVCASAGDACSQIESSTEGLPLWPFDSPPPFGDNS